MAGEIAVVTGASTGIGYELAKQFVKHGYDLMIVADEPQIHTTAKELSEFGTRVIPIQANLATSQGVETVWQEILQLGRPLDAIALNAGVGVSGDFVRDNTLHDELNLIGLNITSVVHLAKYVLPPMVKRGQGRVLITSSIAALMPGPFYATYAASKSFLLSFSEALFNELKGTGVTVTALMPGPTDTEFFRRSGMEDTKAGQNEDKDDPAQVAEQGFKAMMAGEDHVIGGAFKNKVQGFMTKFMTEQQRADIHRAQTEPNSSRAQH